MLETQPRATKTPQRIAKAATILFSRHGYRQVNMEMVAQEAGISRQALYRHFPAKDALFMAITEDLHRTALEAAEAAASAAIRADADLAGVLFAHLDARFSAFMARLEDSPHAEELTDEGTHLAGAIAADYAVKLEESLARIIRAEATAGGLELTEGLTPQELAYLIIAAARGLKQVRPTPPLEQFRARLRRIVELIVAGAVRATST